MKIKLVYNSFPTPSETFLFNLAVNLAERGHDVTMLLMERTNNQNHYKDRIHEWKGSVQYAPAPHAFAYLSYILLHFNKFIWFSTKYKYSGIRKLVSDFVKYSLLNVGNFDIIHFAYTGLALEFKDILTLIPSDTRLIISARGTSEIVKPVIDENRKNQLIRLWPLIDAVHCVSKDIMIRLERLGLDRSKCFINYPSIDINTFTYKQRESSLVNIVTRDSFIIVSTGRLHFSKGFVFALQALRLLREEFDHIEYHILGDGPDADMLKYIASDMQLSGMVVFHGKVSHTIVREQLNKSHVYLQSSIYEGVSNAALEAMALGVPIITTDAGGMAEVVTDGLDGFLIERYNPMAIATAVRMAMSDYGKSVELAINARKKIESDFSLNRQIDIFEQNYKKIISEEPARTLVS